MENNKEHMMVAAIENGSVIDHIPTDKLFTVAQLLDLESCSAEVVIANNLKSQVMERSLLPQGPADSQVPLLRQGTETQRYQTEISY